MYFIWCKKSTGHWKTHISQVQTQPVVYGLPWNLVQTLMIPRGGIIATFIDLLKVSPRGEVKLSKWNILYNPFSPQQLTSRYKNSCALHQPQVNVQMLTLLIRGCNVQMYLLFWEEGGVETEYCVILWVLDLHNMLYIETVMPIKQMWDRDRWKLPHRQNHEARVVFLPP